MNHLRLPKSRTSVGVFVIQPKEIYDIMEILEIVRSVKQDAFYHRSQRYNQNEG